jgi:hypothetical protein
MIGVAYKQQGAAGLYWNEVGRAQAMHGFGGSVWHMVHGKNLQAPLLNTIPEALVYPRYRE